MKYQELQKFPILKYFFFHTKPPFPPFEGKIKKKEKASTGFSSLIEIFSTSNMFNVVETTDVIALIL